MKNILILGLICFSITNLVGQQCTTTERMQNVLNVQFNQDDGQIIISGIDPCSYTEEELLRLECHNQCELLFNECIEKCKSNFKGLSNLAQCVERCGINNRLCINNCGPIPEPAKTAVSYFFAVQLWYTTGFVETFDGDPREKIVSNEIDGAPPSSLIVDLENILPDESLSYCYFTEPLIQYDDGSCCYFQDFSCILKG